MQMLLTKEQTKALGEICLLYGQVIIHITRSSDSDTLEMRVIPPHELQQDLDNPEYLKLTVKVQD